MGVMHPKVLTDPYLQERYGIKASSNRRFIYAGIFLSLVAAWFIWSVLMPQTLLLDLS